MRCPSCSSAVPDGSRYCPGCAAPIGGLSQTPTLVTLDDASSGSRVSSDSSSDASRNASSAGRFVPGVVLAQRYRIVALLGTGGMGEVYRADDLKLGQPVALKFLPQILANDQGRVARFFNEVRVARQVGHPNVCRVYDLGEADGSHFLSMEYVDGEDLASLLRRIGHMPPDRAIQIARQLCAGLAAAHQAGILHRDLKPANIMIDGRGRARITDFGLAAAANQIAPGEVRVGTPAYMAPEQLAGRQVSVKSDLYSLGLVLYEMFTGLAAYRADSPAELLRTQQEDPPASPSSVVGGIEPAVERAILRCLENDPRLRPPSALAVAAALPGGDPLAAALAAGETPSPEMVADAGSVGGMRPAVAAACFVSVLIGLLLVVVVAGRAQLVNKVVLSKPPEALVVEAREIAQKAGYTVPPADTVYGFDYDGDYIRSVQAGDPSPRRWDGLAAVRPAPLYFWYRESPRSLVPVSALGMVDFGNPPAAITGMIQVKLDPQGRLLAFLVVPPQRDAEPEPAVEPEWSALFASAGLDAARFTPADPIWNPLVNCGRRAAWTGEYADRPGVPMRVEGCWYGAHPVWFEVLPPWAKPRRMEVVPTSASLRVAGGIGLVIAIAVVGAGVLLARRNLRLGRSDRRGAFRMALTLFLLQGLYWLLRTHHVGEFHEVQLFVGGMQDGLLVAALVWLIYVALEPSVRRLWPDVLISWNRLLAGRFTDPLVGRDLLVGGVLGVLSILGLTMLNLIPAWIGEPAAIPQITALDPLVGLPQAIGLWLGSQTGALAQPIAVLFLVLLLRVLVRRQWVAVSLVVLLFATFATLVRVGQGTGPPSFLSLGTLMVFLVAAAVWTLMMIALIRFGLLACIFVFFIANSAFLFPISPNLSTWYAARSMFSLVIVVAVTIYAFVIARTGKAAAWDEMLEARVGGA